MYHSNYMGLLSMLGIIQLYYIDIYTMHCILSFLNMFQQWLRWEIPICMIMNQKRTKAREICPNLIKEASDQ